MLFFLLWCLCVLSATATNPSPPTGSKSFKRALLTRRLFTIPNTDTAKKIAAEAAANAIADAAAKAVADAAAANACPSCQNGGTGSGTVAANDCACLCTTNYQGTLCETAKQCTTGGNGQPCENGGNVTGTIAADDCGCSCTSGFTGTQCETEDTCVPQPFDLDEALPNCRFLDMNKCSETDFTWDIDQNCQLEESLMFPEYRELFDEYIKFKNLVVQGRYTGNDRSRRIRMRRPSELLYRNRISPEVAQLLKDLKFHPHSTKGFRFFTVLDGGKLTLRHITLAGGRGTDKTEPGVGQVMKRTDTCTGKCSEKDVLGMLINEKINAEVDKMEDDFEDLLNNVPAAIRPILSEKPNKELPSDPDRDCSCLVAKPSWFENRGGAVVIEGSGTAVFEYVTFERNSADLGGAVFVSSTSTVTGKPSVKFHHVFFDRNQASSATSGVLHVEGQGTVVVVDSMFTSSRCGSDLHYNNSAGALWLDTTAGGATLTTSGSGNGHIACPTGMSTTSPWTTTTNLTCTTCPEGQYMPKMSGQSDGGGVCMHCPRGQKLLKQTPDMYYHHESNSSCTFCPAGYYDGTNRTGTACNVCGKGKWKNDSQFEVDLFACHECSAGRYLGDDGIDFQKHDSGEDCEKCPPGQLTGNRSTQTDSTGASFCGTCSAGRFLDGKDCKVCKTGQYRNGRDGNVTSMCIVCPTGFAQNDNGSSTCVNCVPGEYQNERGSNTCKRCPVNQFTDTSNELVCKKCWPGFSTDDRPDPNTPDEPGMNWCLPCAAGKIGAGGWGSDCIECKVGKHRALHNEKLCRQNLTVALNFQKSVKNDSTQKEMANAKVHRIQQAGCHLLMCIDCPAGWFNSRNGSDKCQLCGAGKYNDDVGGEDCKRCQPGQFRNSSTKDVEFCFECPPGEYQSDEGRTACIRCPPGEYQSDPGRTACIQCPKGYYGKNQTKVRNACVSCVSGKYIDIKGRGSSNTATCVDCPSGYYNNEAAQSSCSNCDPGFYHIGTFQTNKAFRSTNWPCVACGMTWEKKQNGDYFPKSVRKTFSEDRSSNDGSPVGEFSEIRGAGKCE